MWTDSESNGPTPADLAAIETEWPAIERDLEELDLLIRALYAADHGPDELDRRRVRRRESQVIRTAAKAATPVTVLPVAA